MKALSLKQPWADLIVQGKKIIETRKWRTNFRGEFYIHASKSFDKKNCESFGIKNPVTGALIGKVELVNVKEYKNKKEFDEDYRKHFAKNFVRYGYLLRNIKRINPVPYKGKLNFFEVKTKHLNSV
ncbi:MAG: hypothetical protein QT11_C0001G1043 [archaeon GW2011_AR20]|nr:MAG: hypothetical protein QT11_C0001G1043 [archaeon GW2011_AR20]AQS33400.1 hypothetical protein [uncultured archaeon]MBS3160987.1 ASCH domain-containing protein [Candidatus Woesearchaeota archaeon]AQS33537.1 hypothetical protein [uncultured archaeon]AQS34545.1 hypothetical protein [uncultured archaeon]